MHVETLKLKDNHYPKQLINYYANIDSKTTCYISDFSPKANNMNNFIKIHHNEISKYIDTYDIFIKTNYSSHTRMAFRSTNKFSNKKVASYPTEHKHDKYVEHQYTKSQYVTPPNRQCNVNKTIKKIDDIFSDTPTINSITFTIRICKNCKHYYDVNSECRFNPPPFPITLQNNYCGKFEAK